MTTDEHREEGPDIPNLLEVTSGISEVIRKFWVEHEDPLEDPDSMLMYTPEGEERLQLFKLASDYVALLRSVATMVQELYVTKPMAAFPVTDIEGARERVLGMLDMTAELKDRMEAYTDRTQNYLMQRARIVGHSWQEIGDAIGMSAQGAYKRAEKLGQWVRLDREKPSS